MRIEVDQSGKIEQLNKDTCIAFSNQEQYCIKVSKKVKQDVFYLYKNKVKQIIPKLFAICLFYCLKDYLRGKELITIDLEYPGWEADIKTYLIPLLKSEDCNFDKTILKFNVIGKESKAHKFAKLTYNRKLIPNRVLTKAEILKLLK